MDRLLSMRVFQQVAQSGGFAVAARELDLSPAVVTRLVADLEEHLGVRLLQRTTRRVALTEAGQAYLGRVRHILQDIEDAHAAASAHAEEMAGVLRIQAPPVLAVHILAPLLAGFRALHPRVTFDIDVDVPNGPHVEEHDITLMVVDAGFDGQVIARPILSSYGVLVAAPDSVKRRGAPLQPADLSAHDTLRVRSPGVRQQTWRLMQPAPDAPQVDVPVQPVVWTQHTDTLLRATLGGVGIASLPIELVAPMLACGSLVRLLAPWITGHYTLFAALPSRRFLPQRTRAFLDYLTEQTRALVAQTASSPMGDGATENK
jgi:DNA-binding transcriptional LysR family regulator